MMPNLNKECENCYESMKSYIEQIKEEKYNIIYGAIAGFYKAHNEGGKHVEKKIMEQNDSLRALYFHGSGWKCSRLFDRKHGIRI